MPDFDPLGHYHYQTPIARWVKAHACHVVAVTSFNGVKLLLVNQEVGGSCEAIRPAPVRAW